MQIWDYDNEPIFGLSEIIGLVNQESAEGGDYRVGTEASHWEAYVGQGYTDVGQIAASDVLCALPAAPLLGVDCASPRLPPHTLVSASSRDGRELNVSFWLLVHF